MRLCKINPLYEINRYEPAFSVDRCAGCGFIFMNPRFKKSVLAGFYGDNYYTGNAGYTYYDERDAEKFAMHVWRKRIEKIHDKVKTGSFLDVGCAFGGLLKAAQKYYKPYGIELSEYSGGVAKSIYGNNIHLGTLEDHPFREESFSVITMIELIEHLPDPLSAVKECYRLLKPGGLLLIQTANMDGLQAKIQGSNYAYYMPGHLSYLSKKNILMILRKCGFKKILFYHPVDFGLFPKLMKSRYGFKTFFDYSAWIRISLYHLAGKIRFRNFSATSSLVTYGIK